MFVKPAVPDRVYIQCISRRLQDLRRFVHCTSIDVHIKHYSYTSTRDDDSAARDFIRVLNRYVSGITNRVVCKLVTLLPNFQVYLARSVSFPKGLDCVVVSQIITKFGECVGFSSSVFIAIVFFFD